MISQTKQKPSTLKSKIFINMLNPFVCGTFNPIDDDELFANPDSSPRRYKRKNSKNNPYSTRGLDKFSALLSDLNDKRQKIYSQMNPHDISYIRFVHSNKDDFVPIIVKVKNKSQEIKVVKARNLTNSSTDQSSSVVTMEKRNQPKKRISMNVKKIEMDKPMLYLAFVVIMILLMLTVFGRTVTTIFTCVLWYANPTMKDGSLSSRTSMKKDFGRGLSEKKMVVTSDEGVKKKDYERWFSERKMAINEGVNEKKKDYVRRWSEKKMVSGTNDGLVSPRSGGDSDEASSKNKIHGKRSHRKS
ncbi:uncharacterized protein LOC127098257 [Lathyrus oleraceus]|uniref:uncharacterized protein LOC127098257 n=1 Tax=Pisum sativum TaxID=3888 RepID=UPI001FC4BB7E|nr:uncharacterized protein LOC127098257 [Pisum sativum]